MIKIDDGDGHIDEATVEILATVPTPTPRRYVGGGGGRRVTPTPSPTPTPTTPTPTPTPEEPGFGAVFAIGGLLAVAYLVLRRKH
jgi:PGF-CTERM protein